MNNIIAQWNMQSYFTKFTELKSILHTLKPLVFCLQETMIANRNAYPPSQYDLITSTVHRDDNHERGAAMLIHPIFNRC